jgi:colanic acid/amylovoran biosynthesis glycosyltransferase
MADLKVAYLVLHFPRLTETFVAEEIKVIRERGGHVRIISLLAASAGPVQPTSNDLLECTWYAPGMASITLWEAQVYFLRKSAKLYLQLLSELVRQPRGANSASVWLKRLVIFAKAVAAARHLEGGEFQLVHAHFAWLSGAAAWVCARLLGLPFTVTVHAYDVFSEKRDLLPLVSREAARVVVVSEANRREIVALGNRFEPRVAVIHSGVDVSRLGRIGVNRRTPPEGSELRILSVGSLVPKKGHRYLVEACRLVGKHGLDFRCTIIGEGPEKPALANQIRASGLGEHVFLLGERLQSDVIDAYLSHDVFVLSSVVAADGDRDGIPIVLMEAGAMGLPLISTPLSGIPELILQGETGILVPEADPLALAGAIERLAFDRDLRRRLGEGAAKLIAAGFDIDMNAGVLEELFHGVISRARADTAGFAGPGGGTSRSGATLSAVPGSSSSVRGGPEESVLPCKPGELFTVIGASDVGRTADSGGDGVRR